MPLAMLAVMRLLFSIQNLCCRFILAKFLKLCEEVDELGQIENIAGLLASVSCLTRSKYGIIFINCDFMVFNIYDSDFIQFKNVLEMH